MVETAAYSSRDYRNDVKLLLEDNPYVGFRNEKHMINTYVYSLGPAFPRRIRRGWRKRLKRRK